MSAKILDGEVTAKQIKQEVADKIKIQSAKRLRAPSLAVIMVGNNPASHIYVAKKEQACKEVGIVAHNYNLKAETTEPELLTLIEKLNLDAKIDGILVQLPLPKHINANTVLEKIDPKKDVDGFHAYNLGRLVQAKPLFRPCTPKGIMTLITRNIDINLEGIDATIIGHSNIVGKPMALELLAVNATVSICHIFTHDIKPYIAKADLLIVAAGVPNLVKGKWIKKGAIVIDVGINRLQDDKIVGDVEFTKAKERAAWITPVPGGVGPMTVATLMENTLYAFNSRS